MNTQTRNSYELSNSETAASVVTTIQFSQTRDKLNKLNASPSEWKGITSNILDIAQEVGFNDKKVLNKVNNKLNSLIHDKDIIHMIIGIELIRYFCNKSDVIEISFVDDKIPLDLIIIIEDSSSETVIEYNEFCYSIMDKYDVNIINDFMIFDKEEIVGIVDSYGKLRKIYQRGDHDARGNSTSQEI